MPQHVSLLMWFGVAVPAALIVACMISLARFRRAVRFETVRRAPAARLSALPPQPGPGGPHREFVELTPAERDAFAGLIRQLDEGH
ncbi:hypothetical protein ACF1B0_35195 [Streptomyces anandii]|uniref:hypothetical protein n=1 Tax=Streptomyces anandii TaxID=285454 RepID=UPI0036F9D942